MGFLHKLWDETLAGPTPDSGLGKLRKYNSFSARSTNVAPPSDVAAPPVSRSITMLRSGGHDSYHRRSNLSFTVDSSSSSSSSASVPSSPSGSTTPSSPFSPSSPGGNFKKFTRRKSTTAALHNSEPKSPTGYDWIVLSSLDR